MTDRCPTCGSKRLYKDGLRRLTDGTTVQRWLCRECGYRFSNSNHKNYVDFSHGQKVQNIAPSRLNESSTLSYGCQVGASRQGKAKNLAKVANPSKVGLAGATKPTRANAKGKIIELLWWMQKQGYKESTITSRGDRLRRLMKLGADLFDSENVKEIIATQDNWSESRKEAMVYAYDLFAKRFSIKWEKPEYNPCRKLPFIPLEREIDDLVAGCNKYIAAFLQLGKETGARAGELFSLEWTDIDSERRIVRITPEKGSNPRLFKISNKSLGMLGGFKKDVQRIFNHYGNLNSLRRCFERYRKRTAHKLANPRILRITFHTLRHWKATMEYHKTKDILYVKQLLGHRSIKNTLLYTQLVKFREEDDDFVCKVAKSPNEVQGLIENGFEYICDMDNLKFFRKRK